MQHHYRVKHNSGEYSGMWVGRIGEETYSGKAGGSGTVFADVGSRGEGGLPGEVRVCCAGGYQRVYGDRLKIDT